MDEHITAAFFFDETVTLCVIKPFDLARSHETLLARDVSGALYHGAMPYVSSSLAALAQGGVTSDA
jgi:hypothetical protein